MCKPSDKETLADEVSAHFGDGVLFILDGFDELPVPLQQEGFIVDLINKTVLPKSMVVVTSRPSATAQLLTSCKPLIWKHIEILGFTQQSVEAYAASVFTDQEELERFLTYISASQNPAINSLMYVPINAAIIVQIYRNSESKSSLPHTLTQLYTQLCLTVLNKYMQIEHPFVHISNFESLPDNLYQQFLNLSRVAFEGVRDQQVIFYSKALPSEFNHFGFLDAVSTLYGGGDISYNFLHLTLQEFFAAYYISQLPDSGVSLFEDYGENERWNVVWRFVAGLTEFKFFEGHEFSSAFSKYPSKRTRELKIFFIHCLFEAQKVLDFESTFRMKSCSISMPTSPFDQYAVGYCIANCSSKSNHWCIGISESIRSCFFNL